MSDKWDQALEDLLARPGADSGAAPDAGPQDAEASLGKGEAVRVGVLVSPFAQPEVLAWALGQLDIAGLCLPAGIITLAVLDDPTEASTRQAGIDLSKALAQGEAVALWRGPSDHPTASDMQAFICQGGEVETIEAPGLLLAQMPEPIEDVLVDPEGSGGLLATGVSSLQPGWSPDGHQPITNWWLGPTDAPKAGPDQPSAGPGGPAQRPKGS